MKTELSYVEISRIHSYVEGMGVEFYDVQLEIVDHIASVIETEMNLNPKRPFRALFDSTLASFDDFDIIVEEKQKQVLRQYNRYFRDCLVSFFKLPKVLFTAVFLIVTYQFLKIAPSFLLDSLKNGFFWGGMVCVLGYYGFVFWRNQVQYHKLCNTHLLIWFFPIFSQVPQGLVRLTDLAQQYRNEYTLVFALCYTFSFIVFWSFIESNEKLRAYGRKKYLKALA
jgi:hypothetical protein